VQFNTTSQHQVAAYVLNFNGRVTMASVKNFQLVTPEDQDSVVLQFGRVAKDEFTMDFQWPMSPFQVLIHALYKYAKIQ
jgi:tubby and related proteins